MKRWIHASTDDINTESIRNRILTIFESTLGSYRILNSYADCNIIDSDSAFSYDDAKEAAKNLDNALKKARLKGYVSSIRPYASYVGKDGLACCRVAMTLKRSISDISLGED